MPCLLEKMFLNPVTMVTYTRHDFVGKKNGTSYFKCFVCNFLVAFLMGYI